MKGRVRKAKVFLSWSLPLFFFVFPLLTTGAEAELVDRSFCKTYPGDKAIKWDCLRLDKGETLEKLFGQRWRDVARFNRMDRRHAHAGVYIKSPRRPDDLRGYLPLPVFFEPARDKEKLILVDLSRQFLGAYEHGRLVFSAPVASGKRKNKTPAGRFRVSAFNSRHKSSVYFLKDSDEPYPMNYGLRFYIDGDGISYWLHGRDLPGYPASHGCVGLYDEQMQKEVYGSPRDPELADARKLFEWALSPFTDDGRFHVKEDGPEVWVIDRLPLPGRAKIPEIKVANPL